LSSELVLAAVRNLSAGSKALVAGFAASVSAAVIAYGRVPGERVTVLGLSVPVPTQLGEGLLVIFALAMAWLGSAQFFHAGRLLHKAEFVELVPPHQVRLGLTGTSLVSQSPGLMWLMDLIAMVCLDGVAFKLGHTSLTLAAAVFFASGLYLLPQLSELRYPFNQNLTGLWLAELVFAITAPASPNNSAEYTAELVGRFFRKEGMHRLIWLQYRYPEKFRLAAVKNVEEFIEANGRLGTLPSASPTASQMPQLPVG